MSKVYFAILIFLFLVGQLMLAGFAFASNTDGTIDSTYKYAWTENAGWLNFGTTEGNVHITDSALTGYAWGENIGWVSLNCSNDNSCSAVDYKVSNDGKGNLSGYAWSENTGWINFNPTYGGVTINSSGEFLGYAWGENIGWIVFNCATTNSCAAIDYKVKTDWRPQSGGGGMPSEWNNPPTPPKGGFSVLINQDAEYTNSSIVTLTLGGGPNTSKMAISNFPDFKDAGQENYATTKTWDLCKGLATCPEGKYVVYAKFYAPWGKSSEVVSDDVVYKPGPGAPPSEAPTPPPSSPSSPEEEVPGAAPPCQIDCQKFSYDLYIVNPDGTERHMSSNYAKVKDLGLGKVQVRFEDKGSDFDYDDLIFTVEKSDCQKLTVTLASLSARWHHQIKMGLIYDGEIKKDLLLWSDSHLALNSPKVVSLSDYPDICLAEVVPSGVTLFEHINYQGRRETFTLLDPDLRDNFIRQDAVSSIKVFGKTRAVLFEHINYEGKKEVFQGDDPDLRNNLVGQDTVSSLQVKEVCEKTVEFNQTLSLGSTGSQVRELQKLLQCLGYFREDVLLVEYFGLTTQDSVRKFQVDYGISPTGTVGPLTREALNKF